MKLDHIFLVSNPEKGIDSDTVDYNIMSEIQKQYIRVTDMNCGLNFCLKYLYSLMLPTSKYNYRSAAIVFCQ